MPAKRKRPDRDPSFMAAVQQQQAVVIERINANRRSAAPVKWPDVNDMVHWLNTADTREVATGIVVFSNDVEIYKAKLTDNFRGVFQDVDIEQYQPVDGYDPLSWTVRIERGERHLQFITIDCWLRRMANYCASSKITQFVSASKTARSLMLVRYPDAYAALVDLYDLAQALSGNIPVSC